LHTASHTFQHHLSKQRNFNLHHGAAVANIGEGASVPIFKRGGGRVAAVNFAVEAAAGGDASRNVFAHVNAHLRGKIIRGLWY
jgi:hypothetical protein